MITKIFKKNDFAKEKKLIKKTFYANVTMASKKFKNNDFVKEMKLLEELI